jgi:hypothetical protein
LVKRKRFSTNSSKLLLIKSAHVYRYRGNEVVAKPSRTTPIPWLVLVKTGRFQATLSELECI